MNTLKNNLAGAWSTPPGRTSELRQQVTVRFPPKDLRVLKELGGLILQNSFFKPISKIPSVSL